MSSTTRPVQEQAPKGSLEELRDRIAAAFRAQFPSRQADGTYRYSYVVGTYADSVIVNVDSSEGEKYFRYDYSDDGESITFTNPREMELHLVPVEAIAEAVSIRAQRVSRPRQQFRETREVSEAAASGDTITLTVIRAGFNVGKSRYYTEAAVREGAGVFRGLKMYIDHQTDAESRARPEGSLRDWAAVITETAYDANTKSLRATAKLIDPDFTAKVQKLAEAGLLDTLGVSIRAVGEGETATVESVSTFRVDEFVAGISVDFVTEPGAGGHVDLLEAAEEPVLEALTLPLLRERRPDLVAALLSESKQQSKEAGMGDITQEQLDAEKRRADEAERKAKEAEEKSAAAESALKSAQEAQAKAEAQEAIGKLITESGLQEPSQEFLRESLKDHVDVEQAKAAIESHKAYVARLTGKGTVKGNGPTTQESGVVSRSLEESFKDILGDPAAAKLAAEV